MGKKKNTKNAEKPKRYAGVRFSMDEYYLIGTDGENITMTSNINGVTTEYDVTGGGGGGATIEPLEVSEAATDKNFRAVPEVVYGYKKKEN